MTDALQKFGVLCNIVQKVAQNTFKKHTQISHKMLYN